MRHPNSPYGAVLIIDPESDEVQDISLNLRHYGYTVSAVPVGKDAVEVVRETQPDLVLTTLDLRNVAEICRQIKRDNAPGFLPIILIVNIAADGPEASAE